MVKKALFRIFRILTFRKGIYCKYGKKTKFKNGVLIDEKTVIGDYSYFGRYVTISNTQIGNYCSVASFVEIGPGEHLIDDFSTSERINDLRYPDHSLVEKHCIIGNDVWIGTRAVVLRGVKIGNGAIIGAGAVVTKDIPPYAIVGGVPAKIIRYRNPSISIEILDSSKWWNNPPIQANSYFDKMEEKK